MTKFGKTLLGKGIETASLTTPWGIARKAGKTRKEAEAGIAGTKEGIRADIEGTPTYEMPAEVQQLLDLYQAQGQRVEELAGLGQEATDIARLQTAQAEMPGMGIAREQIESGTAGTVQNILEAGGGGAGAMGAIAQAGQNELNAMRDLSIQNQQYKQQASDEYRQALMSQAGLESSLIGSRSGGRVHMPAQLRGHLVLLQPSMLHQVSWLVSALF